MKLLFLYFLIVSFYKEIIICSPSSSTRSVVVSRRSSSHRKEGHSSHRKHHSSERPTSGIGRSHEPKLEMSTLDMDFVRRSVDLTSCSRSETGSNHRDPRLRYTSESKETAALRRDDDACSSTGSISSYTSGSSRSSSVQVEVGSHRFSSSVKDSHKCSKHRHSSRSSCLKDKSSSGISSSKPNGLSRSSSSRDKSSSHVSLSTDKRTSCSKDKNAPHRSTSNDIASSHKSSSKDKEAKLEIASSSKPHGKDYLSQIFGYLFLSGKPIAQDNAILKEFGITHVIDFTGRNPKENEVFLNDLKQRNFIGINDNGINRLRLSFRDSSEEKLEKYFKPVNLYVDYIIDQSTSSKPTKVLFHCQVGMSRSVAFVVALLMQRHNFSCQDALRLVQSKRGIANPNSGFIQQLKDFEKRLKKEKNNPLVNESWYKKIYAWII